MNKKKIQRKKIFLKITINVLILAIAALGLMALLTWLQFIGDWGKVTSFITDRTKIFYYTALLIFLWLLFLVGLTGRVNQAVGISFFLLIVITYINKCKFRLRGTPLLPEDFQLAGETESLTDFIDYSELFKVILAVVLLVVLTVIIGKIMRTGNLDIFQKTNKRYANALGRITIIVLSAVLLVFATIFVRHHHGEKYEYINWLNTTFTAWNQTRNYNENGFILGFLYNVARLEVRTPEGYSEDEISAIKHEFEKKQKNNIQLPDAELVSESEDTPNIVIILNESFIDPESIKYYYDYNGGDVTPNLHRIENKSMYGTMYSIDYGGGTANIEFEVLTGLTNYWLNTVPYTNLLSKRGKIETIASELKDSGYATIAIHPYNGGMYKRNIVLKNGGFEQFITESEMTYRERDGESEYINDWSSYQEILKVLKESKKEALVFNITMQNHTPFKQENYPELHYRLVGNENIDDGRRTAIEAFFETVHASDGYLGTFIDEIDNMDEKTVVLFFGDHSAGIFDELRDSSNPEDVKATRYTPYFIYANYDVGSEKYIRGSELEMVTPNCIVTKMRGVLGMSETPLNLLTKEVCNETPILTPTYYNYQEIEKTELLRKYELVTYDLTAGKKYWSK